MNKFFSAILSASLVLGSAAVASAQQAPSGPVAGVGEQRATAAQTSGPLARYIVGPGGHVRGFQLQNGAVVMLPPRDGAAFVQRVSVGQSVQVQGYVRQGSGPAVFHRATVRASDGSVIVEARQREPGMRRGMRRGRPQGGEVGAGRRHDRFARMAALPTAPSESP